MSHRLGNLKSKYQTYQVENTSTTSISSPPTNIQRYLEHIVMHKHSSHQGGSFKSTLCSRHRVSSVSIFFLFLSITSGLVSANSNPDPFIVVFKQIHGNSSSIGDHLKWIHNIDKNATNPSTFNSNGVIGSFQWYSGSFDPETLETINSSDVVEYVIEDVTFKIQEQMQSNPPSWVSVIDFERGATCHGYCTALPAHININDSHVVPPLISPFVRGSTASMSERVLMAITTFPRAQAKASIYTLLIPALTFTTTISSVVLTLGLHLTAIQVVSWIRTGMGLLLQEYAAVSEGHFARIW